LPRSGSEAGAAAAAPAPGLPGRTPRGYPAVGRAAMISYAQAKEDIMLWRCLAGRVSHEVGFYIDIGANDPEIDSVTKVFYENGWRGINVEPSFDWHARLCQERPRDINIQAAVTDQAGPVIFHDIDGQQLGTMVVEFADRHVAAGMTKKSYAVDGVTLSEICEKHAPPAIHFLKIDVEGHEGAVLRGMDFARFRPWLLIIEATEPNRLDIPTYAEWDPLVLGAGYTFAYTDVLNRYYVANEHSPLLACFALPPDDYVHAIYLRQIRRLEQEVTLARARIGELEAAASR
jgi:FkbM family methyltransferase